MKKLKKILPFFLIILTSIIFFYRFFFKGLIPIPTDITVGMYYPWLNYKWGNLVGVPVKNPLMSDIVSIIYQWRMAAINAIKSGKFPLWNPSYFLGMPLFANFQNSLINFTNIVFFLPLSKATNWGLMIYLQSLFSLTSIFLYLKSIKIKTLPSLIASLVYSYSLFTIVWLEYGVHIYTAAFLPLILLCVEKLQKTKSLKYLTLISILVALQIYGGYPQYAIYI